MDETKPAGLGSSHTISVLNPPRQSRIDNEVGSIVDEAISEAVDQLVELTENGDATAAEIRKALRWFTDFVDAFDEGVS